MGCTSSSPVTFTVVESSSTTASSSSSSYFKNALFRKHPSNLATKMMSLDDSIHVMIRRDTMKAIKQHNDNSGCTSSRCSCLILGYRPRMEHNYALEEYRCSGLSNDVDTMLLQSEQQQQEQDTKNQERRVVYHSDQQEKICVHKNVILHNDPTEVESISSCA